MEIFKQAIGTYIDIIFYLFIAGVMTFGFVGIPYYYYKTYKEDHPKKS